MSAPDNVVDLADYRRATPSERLRFVAGLVAWGLKGDDDRAREALRTVKALAVNCWDDVGEDGTL